MKITELLNESRTDEVVGAALRGIGAAGRALFPSAAKPAALNVTGATTKTQAARDTIKAVKGMGLDPKSFFGKLAKRSVYKDALKNISVYQAQAKSKVLEILGDKGLQYAKLLYIADSIYDYYTGKAILDAKLKSGKITNDEYEKELNLLRGQLVTGFLVPAIAGGITRLTAGNAVNLSSWLIKTVGFPNQAIMLKALKDITIKGGQAGLLAFFSTDKGREFLTDSFGFMVTGVGNIAEIAAMFVDYAKAGYQVATGTVPDGVPSPSGTSSGGQSGTPNTSADPTDIMTRAIGGSGMFADPFKGTTRGR
jgi:hypothetical protein